MTRRWSVGLALFLLAFVGACQVLALISPFRELLVGARYLPENPLAVVLRAGSFFVPLSTQDAHAEAMRPWAWLPRVVAFGSLAVSVHLVGRALTASAGLTRAAVLGAAATLLAGGLAEVAGLAIATWRSAVLFERDTDLGPLSFTTGLSTVESFWTSDALFFSFWLSMLVAQALALCYFVSLAAQINQASGSIDSYSSAGGLTSIVAAAGLREPIVRDVPGVATKLAVLGITPVLAVAFLGGADRFTTPQSLSSVSLVDALADYVLYLKLRPIPPMGEFGQQVVTTEQWLISAALAALFIVVLWLLLRFVMAGYGSPERTSGVAVLVTAWGVTILVGAGIAVVDTVATSTAAAIVTPALESFFLRYLQGALVDGMRFGVAWGWLVGLMVLVGYKRIRIPAVALSS